MKVIVATHHSPGITVGGAIFRRVSNHVGWSLWHRREGDPEPSHWDIALLNKASPEMVKPILRSNFRILHFVQRPKSLIFSTTQYHLEPIEHLKSREKWLFEPHQKFQGRSYREMLESFSSFEEQLEFEMENSSLWTINQMAHMVRSDLQLLSVRLEEFFCDRSLRTQSKMLRYVGLQGRELLYGIACCLQHAQRATKDRDLHYTRLVGNEWRDVFVGRLQYRYQELYGGMAQELGYGE